MQVGLCTFVTEYSIDPVRLGRLAEERGFDSIFFPEHTHIPVSRDTPYPGGGDLPREYSHMLDPFVALAAVASVTERIELGIGIVLLIERDPIVTAKEAATLDLISGGRLLLGVGAGWNLEEMRNHGTDPGRRFGILRERVEAMKEIWTSDEAEYHGEHVDFDPIWAWPKPVRKPHPPVLVGGMSDGALDRVVAIGDEWMPNRVVQPGGAGWAHRRSAAPGRRGGPRPDPRPALRREGRDARGPARARRGGRLGALLPAHRGRRRGRAPARHLADVAAEVRGG